MFFKLSYIKSKFALTLTLNNPARTCSHNCVAHYSQFWIVGRRCKFDSSVLFYFKFNIFLSNIYFQLTKNFKECALMS